jgi:hypothetical protein
MSVELKLLLGGLLGLLILAVAVRSWCCTPMRCRSVDASRRGSSPRMVMVPRSGLRWPSTHSMVVVLPAPFGPMRPKISPCWTSSDTSSTATVEP